MDAKIFNRVQGLAVEHYSGDESDRKGFSETATIRGDGGLDSLDEVEYLMRVEDDYGIEVTDEEAEGIVTFGDMAEMVETKLAAK